MKALCVNAYSDLQQLVAGQVQTVTTTLVERVVCDNIESGKQKIVPYVVFYHMDVNAGKLKFIQYLRPGKVVEGTEDKAPGHTSIGFGVPVHNLADIRASENIVGENGDLSYTMTLQDVMNTAVEAGVREVEEQLGFKMVELLGPVIDPNDIAFFVSEAPVEEVKTMIGVAIPVRVTAKQFDLIKANVTLRPEHIEQLDTLGINIDRIVEEMDITPTINNVVNELVGKYNLEAWSTMMFNYIARKELHEMMKDINYNDIVALVHAKKAAMQQIAQQEIANQQAAAAVSAQAAAVATGQETYHANGMTSLAQPGGHVAPTEEVREETKEQPAG